MQTHIIGGGIIGLATALKLLQSNITRVTVFEKERDVAMHQTGNNSGVIHSGIYYKEQSLKARNCTTGRKLMYQYCISHNIPFQKCGKIIVATDEYECKMLEGLKIRGINNGLQVQELKNSSDIKQYEPYIEGVAGLYIPETGIVDYKHVCQCMKNEIKSLGGKVECNTQIVGITPGNNKLQLTSNHKQTYECNLMINCAGLHCDRIAKLCNLRSDVSIIPFRGEYYKLSQGKHKIKGLVYPVPDPKFPFLGVHFTRHINDEVECGPNAVLAFSREGYKYSNISPYDIISYVCNPGFLKLAAKHWKYGLMEYRRSLSKNKFTQSLNKLYPTLLKSELYEGGSGVRAQAMKNDGTLLEDFCIEEGYNSIHVLNAPSPAATSSLSIGNHIAQIAIERLKKCN